MYFFTLGRRRAVTFVLKATARRGEGSPHVSVGLRINLDQRLRLGEGATPPGLGGLSAAESEIQRHDAHANHHG